MGSEPSKPEDIGPIAESPSKPVSILVAVAKGILNNVDSIIQAADNYVPGVKVPAKLSFAALEYLGLGGDDSLELKKLLDEVRKVVRSELTMEKVDELEASVIGTRQWMRIEYATYAESWSHRELYDELKKKMDGFQDKSVSQLMHRRFCCSKTGLPVFVLAASMHLTMLHDLAVLDPNISDPMQSVHAKILGERAKIYAEYTRKMADQVLQERKDKVKFHQETRQGGGGYGAVGVWINYWWTDEETGQSGKKYEAILYPPASEGYNERIVKSARDEFDRRISIVNDHLHNSLGKPKDIASYWEEVAVRISKYDELNKIYT